MDPSRQDVNPYSYGGGNPVMHIDPSGLVCVKTESGAYDVWPYELAPCSEVADDLITWHQARSQYQSIIDDPCLFTQIVLQTTGNGIDQTAGATVRYFVEFVVRQHRIMNPEQYYSWSDDPFDYSGEYAYREDVFKQSAQLFEISMMMFGAASDIASLGTNAALKTQVLNQIDDELYNYTDDAVTQVLRAEQQGGWGGGGSWSVGFAPGTGESALVGMRGDGGHAMRHLMDEGIIPNRGSFEYRRQIFDDLVIPILENPAHTFDWRTGATSARGFAQQRGNEWIVVLVAKEGPYQGRIISVIVPDINQQLLMGLH